MKKSSKNNQSAAEWRQMRLQKLRNSLANLVMNRSPESELSPSQVADNNRAHGEEIICVLRGIRLNQNKLQVEDDPELLSKMATIRDNLVDALRQANTIYDDISKLDGELMFAASSWKVACEYEGFYNKARWSIAALTKGIYEYRKPIASGQEDRKEQELAARLEQMHHYTRIITHAEAVDSTQRNIDTYLSELRKLEEEYKDTEASLQEVVNDTEEGLKNYAAIVQYQTAPEKMTDSQRQALMNLIEIDRLKRLIDMIQDQLAAEQLKLTANQKTLDDCRQLLNFT